jgi:glycosyltransferase involved in cell wall biosynthesis
MDKIGLIYWTGLPVAGTITNLAVINFKVSLVTESNNTNYNIEKYLKTEVTFLDNFRFIRLLIFLSRFDYFFTSGWRGKYAILIHLIAFLKKAPLILMIDNVKKSNLKQGVARIIFKGGYSKIYSYYLVPGNQTRNYLNYLGVDNSLIYNNYYGANEKIFSNEENYINRKKEFLFVGQLINRKSIIELIEGYLLYHENGGHWRLRIIGEGKLHSRIRKMIKGKSNIFFEGSLNPEEIALKMNRAKALCLFSREDHWATVAAEACACGLPLLLSSSVGARFDLLAGNGLVIDEINKLSISNLLRVFTDLKEEDRITMSLNSVKIGQAYSSLEYLESFKEIVGKLF